MWVIYGSMPFFFLSWFPLTFSCFFACPVICDYLLVTVNKKNLFTSLHTLKKLSTYCSKYTPQSLLLSCLGTLGHRSTMFVLLNSRWVFRLTSHSTSKYLKSTKSRVTWTEISLLLCKLSQRRKSICCQICCLQPHFKRLKP